MGHIGDKNLGFLGLKLQCFAFIFLDEKGDYDGTGEALYLNVCRNLGVVPVSYFLRHMQDSRLCLAHHGLAAQGMKALSYPLMVNTLHGKQGIFRLLCLVFVPVKFGIGW